MDNLIGRTLDGLYAVRELIGTGGMANVYKAVVVGENGPVPVGTVVAVKVLRQELMHDPDLVRRFKNESKAISLLNHPNIVKVYDVSVSETLQYIVMEYVDGMTLREYLNERGGKLTSRETVHFISQILKALDHAHRNGVVHRDIKPQNIMLLDNGQLRILASRGFPGPKISWAAARPWAVFIISARNRPRVTKQTARAIFIRWAS